MSAAVGLVTFIGALILLAALAWEQRDSVITWVCVTFATWLAGGLIWVGFTNALRTFTLVQ